MWEASLEKPVQGFLREKIQKQGKDTYLLRV